LEGDLEKPQDGAEFVGGFTVSDKPVFWFYVPYVFVPETPPTRVARFVLLDENDRPVLNELISIRLHDHPRFVEYSLPVELSMDKVYSWYFTVICDSEKLSRNSGVRGWVQRVETTPELQMALQETSVLKLYEAYASNGIWLETVNSIMVIRRQFSSINQDVWNGLLEYFELAGVNQPDILEDTEPSEREVVSGNQLPANM